MRHLLLILFVFMSLCTMAQEEAVVPSPQVVELTDSLVDDTVSVSMEQVDKVVQKVKKEKRDWSTWSVPCGWP